MTKPKYPNGNREIGTVRQRRLLQEFDAAVREHAFKGSAMPEAHEEIEDNFLAARANALAMLDKARPRRNAPTRIYVWSSEALADHRKGQLAAIATTIEGARTAVRKHVTTFLRERYPDLFDTSDIDNPKRIGNMFDMIDKDLAAEPQVLSVLFIEGAE